MRAESAARRKSATAASRPGSGGVDPSFAPPSARNGFASAPPIRRRSARPRKLVRSGNLSFTFAPPTTTTYGRAGAETSRESARISRSTRSPANEGRRFGTPTVEAWARWTVPKASSTNSSPRRASWAANAGSFASSPGWNRRFSSRRNWPFWRRAESSSASIPHDVAGEGDRLTEQGAQAVGHGTEAEPGVLVSLGAPQVRHEDRARAGGAQVVERREGLDDPAVIGDLAVRLLRDVEVDPHEDASAVDWSGLHPALRHEIERCEERGPMTVVPAPASRRATGRGSPRPPSGSPGRSRPFAVPRRRISPEIAWISVRRPRSRSWSMLERFSAVARRTRSRSSRTSSLHEVEAVGTRGREGLLEQRLRLGPVRFLEQPAVRDAVERGHRVDRRVDESLPPHLAVEVVHDPHPDLGRPQQTREQAARRDRLSARPAEHDLPWPAARISPGPRRVAGIEFTARTTQRSGSSQSPAVRAVRTGSSTPSPFCGSSTGTGAGTSMAKRPGGRRQVERLGRQKDRLGVEVGRDGGLGAQGDGLDQGAGDAQSLRPDRCRRGRAGR